MLAILASTVSYYACYYSILLLFSLLLLKHMYQLNFESHKHGASKQDLISEQQAQKRWPVYT